MILISKVQQYLDWLKDILFLDKLSCSAKNRVVHRGEVYWCKLGIGIGNEMQKERPCIIIQNDVGNLKSPNIIAVPITHDSSTLPTVVPISTKTNNLGNKVLDGNANVSHIITVSKARLGGYICRLDNNEIIDLDRAIARNLSMMNYYSKLDKKYINLNKYAEKLKIDRNKAQDELNLLLSKFEVNTLKEALEKLKKLNE